MRCPYCRHDIRVAGRFCPRCGRQIFGLPATPELPPTSRPPAPTTPPWAIPTFEQPAEPPIELAGPHTVGKTCPFDQYPISVGEQVIVCPECGVPHHADCWRENDGCTTYGCARSPQARTAAAQSAEQGTMPPGPFPGYPGRPPRPPQPTPTGSPIALMVAELERSATNALLWSILGLFCCGAPSLVGFFMAVSVLGTMARIGIDSPSVKMKATWALIVGAAIPVMWAALWISGAAGSGSLP